MGDKVGNLKTIDEADMFDPIPLVWGLERSQTGYLIDGKKSFRALDVKAAFAEMIAMTLFVILGCGTAMLYGPNDGEDRISVAMSFGMSILVLVFAIGHHSGGQINCAVTFSLVLGGIVPWYQGIINFIFQLFGSLLGAQILSTMVPCHMDLTQNLGSNTVNPNFTAGQAILSEMMMTFLLCFVVYETCVSRLFTAGQNSSIAVGFTVFIAHMLLLPITGCSINPTRSFGPAIVSQLRGCDNFAEGGIRDLWIMFVGPGLGALGAAIYQIFFLPRNEHHPIIEAVFGQPIPLPPSDAEQQALMHLEVEKAAQALTEQIVNDPELLKQAVESDVLPSRVIETLESHVEAVEAGKTPSGLEDSQSFSQMAPMDVAGKDVRLLGATSVTTKAIQRAATLKQEVEIAERESQPTSMATGAQSIGSNNHTVNSSIVPGLSNDGASGGSVPRDAI